VSHAALIANCDRLKGKRTYFEADATAQKGARTLSSRPAMYRAASTPAALRPPSRELRPSPRRGGPSGSPYN